MKGYEDIVASPRGLRRSVRQLAESLGPTPDAVAASLADLSIRGVRRSPSECAVARYLRVILGTEKGVADVWVVDRIYVRRTNRRILVPIRPTKAMLRFIYAFDRGGYPELVDPIGEAATLSNIPT
jgi:hypothetical protein